MANRKHVQLLKHGILEWNYWRETSRIKPDLTGVDLSDTDLRGAMLSSAILYEANLRGADLRGANLRRANLSAANLSAANLRRANLHEGHLSGGTLIGANLFKANLSGANLSGADLTEADLSEADLSDADIRKTILCTALLRGANLRSANLRRADLTGADLSGADLVHASLVETNLEKANLAGCSVYGISAWALRLDQANQSDLVITLPGEPTITVDNIEVAQFIYLLLNNDRIRQVIDTITSKAVLILGRFTPSRKAILDAIRDELRRHNYLPILFDFERPESRDLTETVSTLAHLARFIIADITDARSVPQELQAIIPTLAVPLKPLLQSSKDEYGMFLDLRKYPWVLETCLYKDLDELLISLGENIIAPAEAKAKELENHRPGMPNQLLQ